MFHAPLLLCWPAPNIRGHINEFFSVIDPTSTGQNGFFRYDSGGCLYVCEDLDLTSIAFESGATNDIKFRFYFFDLAVTSEVTIPFHSGMPRASGKKVSIVVTGIDRNFGTETLFALSASVS